MADHSYLPDRSGGTLVAAAFADDDTARHAVDVLHASGVRPQDISVIARDRRRAAYVAGEQAWTPWKNATMGGLLARSLAALPRPGGGVPREIGRRYGATIGSGQIVVVVVAGGQPPDTLEALLAQSRGTEVGSWWNGPIGIFAPPELAGPF